MAALLSCSAPVGAQVNPPTEWRLYQTEPNPYCRELHGQVVFRVDVVQAGVIELRVWDPLHVQIVSHVIDLLVLAPGVLQVWWPVRDNQGLALSDGIYPYDVRVTTQSSTLLFEATMTMSITCEVAVKDVTWGVVKKLFE